MANQDSVAQLAERMKKCFYAFGYSDANTLEFPKIPDNKEYMEGWNACKLAQMKELMEK